MFEVTDSSLLRRQLSRFRWLLWCYLPSLVLIWVYLLVPPMLPEHWFLPEKGPRLSSWGLLALAAMWLAVLSNFVINGIIVFKALGERFRLHPLLNALITTAVFFFVFPALDSLLDNPYKHLAPWFLSSMDGAMASSPTTIETLIKLALVLSAQWLSLMAMFAVLPLILILVLALFKRPHRQPSETLP